NENITTLDIEELSLHDINKHVPLLYKTLPKTVTPKRNTPMVSLFSRLSMYPERNQQKKVTSIVACNICWRATKEIDFMTDIVDFQKMPEELYFSLLYKMVFIDPPTQFIKVYAHVLDTSIDYAPANSPTRAVVILDGIQVITDILAGQPMTEIRSFVQSIELYVIDDKRELDEKKAIEKLESRNSTTDSKKYWITMGLSCILAIQNIELKVNLKLDEHMIAPDLAITLPSTNIYMDTSTDAFQTLVNLITFAVNDSTPPAPVSKGKKPKRPSSYVIQMKEDMFSSIEENAFKNDLPSSSSGSSYSKISPPAIEEDDAFDLGYVEEEYFSGSGKKSAQTSSTSQNTASMARHRKHKKKDRDDYITHILDETEDFNMIEDYYSVEKKKSAKKSVVDVNRAKLAVRVRNLNFTWKLYDGYEWDYLRGDMAAYNHAIKQQRSEDRVQTGFGEIPVASGADFEMDPKRFKSPPSRRSKNANIEIKLRGISVDFDLMPERDITAMWFNLLVRDIDIIDNIKTSKWKKFLGYMRPDASEKPRETNSSMIDLEDIMLRPVPGEPSQQEHRVKLKLLPLRSYVDQDALSFLVSFFTFDKSHLRSTAAANLSIPVSVAEDL
ncbi:hypothetical protein K501DRAFT_314690, partial [Backusella circina FSU 941]